MTRTTRHSIMGNDFHGRKSNFSVTALKKSLNPGEINESLHKLRGLIIDFEVYSDVSDHFCSLCLTFFTLL